MVILLFTMEMKMHNHKESRGLVNDNQYYVGYIDANTIQLYEDDSLALLVDLQDTGGGIHTLTKHHKTSSQLRLLTHTTLIRC